MKLAALALIALSASIAAAQSATSGNAAGDLNVLPGPGSQNGCPVAFTNVALKRDARYMPVKQDTAADSSLAFTYKNQSGKPIQSLTVHVELKVKPSIYDLDATTITRDMTLTGHSEAVLPLDLAAYGLGIVTLEKVTYADGKVWTPGARQQCRYLGPASAERIGSFK